MWSLELYLEIFSMWYYHFHWYILYQIDIEFYEDFKYIYIFYIEYFSRYSTLNREILTLLFYIIYGLNLQFYVDSQNEFHK